MLSYGMINTLKTLQRVEALRLARWMMEEALKQHSIAFALDDSGSHQVVADHLFKVKLIDILDEMAILADEGNFDALGFFKNQTAILLDQTNRQLNK